MARLIVFQKAFFCVELKRACYIIAITEMIVFIAMGLLMLMLSVHGEEWPNVTDTSSMVLATTFLLVRGLVCCCLFEGVRKNRRIYVTVYLCTSVCFFFESSIMSISSFIVFLVISLFYMYFTMIVRSYWLVMEIDPEPTEQTETAGLEQLTETSLDISVVH